MKRTTLFAMAALFAAASTAPLAAQGVSVGVKAGVSSSNVSTDQPGFEDTSSRTGIVGGAFLSFGLGSALDVQVEGLYSQEGFGADIGGGSATAKVNYISIPVFLKLNLGADDAQVRPNVFGGGFFAFEASCSLSAEAGGVSASGDCDDEGLDERETTNYGILFGAGVGIALSDNLNLVFDGRYNLGLANLDSSVEGEDDPVRSRGFAFMGGIEIPLGN